MDKQKLVEIISKWTKDFPTDCHGDLADAILKQFHVERKVDCYTIEDFKEKDGDCGSIMRKSYCSSDKFCSGCKKNIKRVIIVNQSKV